ncbi:ABC transporter ATP-binding protein [Terrilactibacillus laevilacticus]|uniref:ABC transporter ATP-binding protein n=1 Tax=Terrilactibacillus laevilacticus TaxID=1380157 RepID=UPI001146EFC1|nr:ATP-binding cassette domain-containing protein [Terrilactibacillus laevilacticus]
MLELKNITFQPNSSPILSHINLTIDEGETVSIIGPSGSGKSTLLRLMADLISPTDGQCYLNGESYINYKPEQLRQTISYCPQTPIIFGETILDNVSFPAKVRKEKCDIKRANYLLTAFNLSQYDLNTNVSRFSGGEKQRLAIIRQLMYVPKFLLLDEATSALDHHNQQLVEQEIFKCHKEKGLGIIWITHDIKQSTRLFSRRLTIEKGKISNEEVIK